MFRVLEIGKPPAPHPPSSILGKIPVIFFCWNIAYEVYVYYIWRNIHSLVNIHFTYTQEQHIKYIRVYVYGGVVHGGRIDGGAYSLFILYTPHQHTQCLTLQLHLHCLALFSPHITTHVHLHNKPTWSQALLQICIYVYMYIYSTYTQNNMSLSCTTPMNICTICN